jgi:hypothetical protein
MSNRPLGTSAADCCPDDLEQKETKRTKNSEIWREIGASSDTQGATCSRSTAAGWLDTPGQERAGNSGLTSGPATARSPHQSNDHQASDEADEVARQMSPKIGQKARVLGARHLRI